MNSLNGGYAMIKYNSTQEELQIAYRSKKPVLCYDENRRAHWAVIEETATESVDEETQEPITIYEYSYRLIDEASGSEVHLYRHNIIIPYDVTIDSVRLVGNFEFHIYSEVPTYTKNELIAHLDDLSLGCNYQSNISTSSTTTQAEFFYKDGNSIYMGGIVRLNNVTYYPNVYFDKPYNNFTFTDRVTQIF